MTRKKQPSKGFVQSIAAILVVLGVGSIWQGMQSTPPEAHGKFAFIADALSSVRYAGTMPLFIVLGLFLWYEAYRMAFSKGRYRRRD